MSILHFEESLFIEVKDLESARVWYEEKLGCYTRPKTPDEDGTGDNVEAAILCRFEKDDDKSGNWLALAKMSAGISECDGEVPIIYCRKIAKAHEFLSLRGVSAGAIQDDGGGSKFFEIRDLEGHLIEICESH